MEEKIVFVDEDGNEVEMYVVEETRINNVNYILVTDDEGEEGEATAYILKDISGEEEEEAVYEIVNDDSEIEYIGKIFSELLDDIDISKED
jgi:uncharacterized protein YrzB (UPF0473 family)